MALNAFNPNFTRSCWLCLSAEPPYYEGIAVAANISNQILPPQKCKITPHQLTLSRVTGSGYCLGKAPQHLSPCCSRTILPHKGQYYLVPPDGTYWACSTGLTLCIFANSFDSSREFCILVQLWPRISYYSENLFLAQISHRIKREPVSMTIALLLGVGGIAARIGTGTAALLQSNKLYELQKAMTTDLEAIERSITALEKSLTSLSEVVLQNRHGLDLLFLKEGGLCAALRKECCFYADQTGVVRESMEVLRDRLDKRKKDFEKEKSWFSTCLQGSPWLSTLLPTIIAPLIVFLLLLSFGPWALNRLTRFVKSQIDSAVKPAEVHYHPLTTEEAAVIVIELPL